jgi:hypothetical protein
MQWLSPNSEAGEHARLGRRWSRLAASFFARDTDPDAGNFSGCPLFSAWVRKTTPGTGALPVSTSEFGLSWTPFVPIYLSVFRHEAPNPGKNKIEHFPVRRHQFCIKQSRI